MFAATANLCTGADQLRFLKVPCPLDLQTSSHVVESLICKFWLSLREARQL